MLAGKSASITGSFGGVGFATAKALAAQGCNVMLNGFADAATIDARQSNCAGLASTPRITPRTRAIRHRLPI